MERVDRSLFYCNLHGALKTLLPVLRELEFHDGTCIGRELCSLFSA